MTDGIKSDINKYPGMIPALTELAARLQEAEGLWMLGGSSSLLLQGVAIPAAPRDIDVYADLNEANRIHELLQSIAVDEPHFDRTERYVSVLSHYSLGSISIELVGGFEVRSEGGVYRTEIAEVLASSAVQTRVQGQSLSLMPLAHEFVFNVLRGRPDRYVNIAAVMRREPQKHMPLLAVLLKRNQWNRDQIARMAELLDQPLLSWPWQESDY
ncbi:hypothetical protein [Paenibacillus sp. GM2]|uniref:hypothetical protein n=1 Tax=Paenibacillus sp. GM2 TaxID=1622070 RepID=UPI000840B7BF|nr:hypothetical protein [Paenibacillus sp. GM2]